MSTIRNLHKRQTLTERRQGWCPWWPVSSADTSLEPPNDGVPYKISFDCHRTETTNYYTIKKRRTYEHCKVQNKNSSLVGFLFGCCCYFLVVCVSEENQGTQED